MKRLLSLLLVVLLTLGFASCYAIDAGEMRQIVGTYELQTFTRTYSGKGPYEAGTVDYIKDKKVVSYLVVAENGNGYYVYKDTETELRCMQVKFTFKPSTDNPRKFEYVEFKDGKGEGKNLGVYAKKKTLSVYTPAIDLGILHRYYSEQITYKRVNTAKDLSYVQKKLGNLTCATFDNYKYHGAYNIVLLDNTYSEYISRYVVYDVFSEKATIKYALKEDGIAREKSVDFTVNSTNNTITFDGNEYGCGNYISRYFTIPTEHGEMHLSETLYEVSAEDVDEMLAIDIESFNAENNEEQAE